MAEMRSGQQADRARGTDPNEGPAGQQDGGPEARTILDRALRDTGQRTLEQTKTTNNSN